MNAVVEIDSVINPFSLSANIAFAADFQDFASLVGRGGAPVRHGMGNRVSRDFSPK